TRTPAQLSHLSKQKASVVHYDVSHINLTPRPRGHPRLLDISTCKVKDATYTPADALPRLPDISTCKPKDAKATPADETLRSVLSVLPNNNNSLKSNVSNKPVTFVNSDVGHIGLTLRPRGRPRLPNISTCKPKDATATPVDEILRSVLNFLPNNNNSLKMTRTPTQVSSISNQTSTVLDSDVGAQSPRISLTPQPIGRRRMTESSTNVTTVGSVTFISTINNGKNLGEISGQTATKVKVKTADEKCCCWNKIEEMAKYLMLLE
nr:hypothetical protein [Tanacetum cinerariifolium]